MLENQFFQIINGREECSMPILYVKDSDMTALVNEEDAVPYRLFKNGVAYGLYSPGLRRVYFKYMALAANADIGDCMWLERSVTKAGDYSGFFSGVDVLSPLDIPDYDPEYAMFGKKIGIELSGFAKGRPCHVSLDMELIGDESPTAGDGFVIGYESNGGSYHEWFDEQTRARNFNIDVVSDQDGFVRFYVYFLKDTQYLASSCQYEMTYRVEQLVTSTVVKIVEESSDLSLLEYKCHEDAFGFPFKSAGYTAKAWIPMIVRHPQPTQNDEIYTTLDGRNIVLFSEVGKEYECETDYIPEEWHDKLAMALACDEVYVNGKLLTRTDKYQINWDEKTQNECGVDIARATFKMKENVIHRNSNY